MLCNVKDCIKVHESHLRLLGDTKVRAMLPCRPSKWEVVTGVPEDTEMQPDPEGDSYPAVVGMRDGTDPNPDSPARGLGDSAPNEIRGVENVSFLKFKVRDGGGKQGWTV